MAGATVPIGDTALAEKVGITISGGHDRMIQRDHDRTSIFDEFPVLYKPR